MNAFVNIQPYLDQLPKTVCHGDYRLGNMLIHQTSNVKYQCALVDWQVYHVGYGLQDFSFMLAVDLPVEVRRSEEKRLLGIYIDKLRKHGVPEKDLDPKEMWDNYKLAFLDYTFMVLMWIVTLLPPDASEISRWFGYFTCAVEDHQCLEFARSLQ